MKSANEKAYHKGSCEHNLNLWHPDGNTLSIPWWVLIVALNIGLWWWQPLLLVIGGGTAVAWILGYRVDQRKPKQKNDS